mmetsp:Transcript_81413/g.225474  ORF Transcript_81413/g.225474 Transcript_81413/m.225474 type:complete len:280 (+) Transcript_81413:259-1098(+)
MAIPCCPVQWSPLVVVLHCDVSLLVQQPLADFCLPICGRIENGSKTHVKHSVHRKALAHLLLHDLQVAGARGCTELAQGDVVLGQEAHGEPVTTLEASGDSCLHHYAIWRLELYVLPLTDTLWHEERDLARPQGDLELVPGLLALGHHRLHALAIRPEEVNHLARLNPLWHVDRETPLRRPQHHLELLARGLPFGHHDIHLLTIGPDEADQLTRLNALWHLDTYVARHLWKDDLELVTRCLALWNHCQLSSTIRQVKVHGLARPGALRHLEHDGAGDGS